MNFKAIKPHFRTHKKNGHPSYIYAENNDEYKYIGITHADKTYGQYNKKLKYNPNVQDPKLSHARPFSTHDKKNNFKKSKLSGYRIHNADKKTIARVKKNYQE